MVVLVVGAGPAGLTLARSLARRGREVRVFERSVTRPDRGLGLWGKAQVALRQLGLGPLLDDASVTHYIPPAGYRSRDGAWLSCSSRKQENRRRVATLLDSRLCAALEAGMPAGTVVRGAAVSGVDQRADGVRLSFEDGSAAEGELVVGADGVLSAVRRLAFPAAAGPVARGWVCHSAILPPPDGRLPTYETDPLAFETLSGGRRFAMVPLARGGAFWFATRRVAPADAPRSHGTDGAAVGSLRAAYDGWHAPIPRVLHGLSFALNSTS